MGYQQVTVSLGVLPHARREFDKGVLLSVPTGCVGRADFGFTVAHGVDLAFSGGVLGAAHGIGKNFRGRLPAEVLNRLSVRGYE